MHQCRPANGMVRYGTFSIRHYSESERMGLPLKGTTAFLASAAAILVLAGCSEKPVTDQRAEQAPTGLPALTVVKWGPEETKRGVSVNTQPDGGSALWISVDGVVNDPGTKVWYGRQVSTPAVVVPGLVTAIIPKDVVDQVGEYEVAIEEPSGRRTVVGVFRVLP